MTGSLALDTSAVIAYGAGVPSARSAVDGAAELVLPAPVLGELLYGARVSARAEENERAVLAMAGLLSCGGHR